MTFEVPLPPRELSPNARVHWAVKAKHIAAYREMVRIIAQSVVRAHSRTKSSTSFVYGEPLPRAKVHVTFILPDYRRRDVGNLIASFKPGLDGLVDAQIIRDDSMKHITERYEARVEKGQSKVVVEVEQCEC